MLEISLSALSLYNVRCTCVYLSDFGEQNQVGWYQNIMTDSVLVGLEILNQIIHKLRLKAKIALIDNRNWASLSTIPGKTLSDSFQISFDASNGRYNYFNR